MSEEKFPVSGIPNPPQRVVELFRVVFTGKNDSVVPPPAVMAEVQSYQKYVQELAASLAASAQQWARATGSEATLAEKAGELLRVESSRRQEMQPYLDQNNVTVAAPWRKLQISLRNNMATELETIRDARLLLEFRKAELINQRASPQVRIVLRGGAQIQVFFQQHGSNAAKKG
ncbi:MAG: hypothetical protein HY847_09550 [Betaproteobacteria bacterium]|nr:hypothetical protein [Betaproteobacteria bacterium]